MKNRQKIILDLCGGTGAWSEPYRDNGYDVRLVTLPDQDVRTYQPPDNVYGILAAPPCTMFSLARTRAKRPRDFKEGMETVEACLKIIWAVRCRQLLKFWALENPRGFLRQFLGKPAFIYEQWQFGDKGIKYTDLWGYFNNPVKLFNERPEDMTHKFPNGSSNAKGWSKTAEKRAITPQGFAKAFFEANK